MKLSKKIIDALRGDFRYSEVPKEAWTDDTWKFEDEPYYKEKSCWRLRNSNGVWLEVPDYLMSGPATTETTGFDIDKACEWLEEYLDQETIEEFRNYMAKK